MLITHNSVNSEGRLEAHSEPSIPQVVQTLGWLGQQDGAVQFVAPFGSVDFINDDLTTNRNHVSINKMSNDDTHLTPLLRHLQRQSLWPFSSFFSDAEIVELAT